MRVLVLEAGRPRLALGRLHPHARRAGLPDREPLLRLALRVGARAAHGRPARVPRAREGAGRVEQHQRDDLPARQPAGLRALGLRRGDGDVGPRPLPAVLQADGELPGGGAGRPVPRALRAARAGAGAGAGAAVRGVLRRGAAGRLPVDRRRERVPPGGLRGVRPQRARRAPAVGRAGVSASGDEAAQPGGADAGVRAGASCSRASGRSGSSTGAGGRALARRGAALRRRDQLAAAAPDLWRGGGRRAGLARRGRRARPARGRREPAGPPRGLRAAPGRAAGLDGALLRDATAARRGAGVAAAQERARERPTTSRRAGSCAATTRSPTRT